MLQFGDGLGRNCRSVGRYRFSVSHLDDFSRLRKMTRSSVSLTVSGESPMKGGAHCIACGGSLPTALYP